MQIFSFAHAPTVLSCCSKVAAFLTQTGLRVMEPSMPRRKKVTLAYGAIPRQSVCPEAPVLSFPFPFESVEACASPAEQADDGRMALQAATGLISSREGTQTSSEKHLCKQKLGLVLPGIALLVFGVEICSRVLHGEGATSPVLSRVPAVRAGVGTALDAQHNPGAKPHNFAQTKLPWRTGGSPESSQEGDCWGCHPVIAI